MFEVTIAKKTGESEGLGILEHPEHYYLSRVITHDNIAGELPQHQRSMAFSFLFTAHIFLRKDDPHPWNLAFVDNDIPVSLDQDHTNLYDTHLSSSSDFKSFVLDNFLFDSIVRPAMYFIAPENLWVLWEDNPAEFMSNAEIFLKFHLGIGYVRNEGLSKKYITQAIKAIKSISNVRALAEEAGYTDQELEDVVEYVRSNQRHLGADIDVVWKDLTGESGGFKELDQAMKVQLQNKNIYIIPNSSDITADTPRQMKEFFNKNAAITRPLYEEAAQKLGAGFSIDRLLLGSLATDRTNLIVLCVAHALYVYAQYKVLQERTKGQVVPDFITGNSIGFLISMVISGALTMDELMTFFKNGLQKMQEKSIATNYGIVQIPYVEPEMIEKVLVRGQIEELGYNLDNVSLGILGDDRAVQEAAAVIAKKLGISPNDIKVFYPPAVKGVHHSFYGESFERELSALAGQIDFKDPQVPIIDSSDSQTPVLRTADQVRKSFYRTILGPVYWAQINRLINITDDHQFIISSDSDSSTRLERYALNEAMTTGQHTGGIDLTPVPMKLQIQNKNGEIRFHMDPAMLAQLRNAPGFVPVIIKIQPVTNLRMFLGINDPVGVDKSV